MRRIALLGGTSWPSTIEYYTTLNKMVQDALGDDHSCPMILYNIDYHEIKSRYHQGWDEIPALLRKEIEDILALRPDGLIICNNTLHKAFNVVRDTMRIRIPVFHIVELTRNYILENGWNRILLLGTRFTMEDSYFRQPITDAGITVEIPSEEDRIEIQRIQTRLAKGEMQDEFTAFFQSLTIRYADYDAFILGCTELPLVFREHHTGPALINTIDLQCRSALKFMLASDN